MQRSNHPMEPRRGSKHARGARAALLAIALTSLFGAATAAANDDFVVVVHADNPASLMDKSQIRQIFRGDRQRWEDSTRIRILLPTSGSPEMRHLVESLFGFRKESELHRYYTASIFNQKFSRAPEVMTVEEILKEVLRSPDAVAIVRRSAVEGVAGVKVVSR